MGKLLLVFTAVFVLIFPATGKAQKVVGGYSAVSALYLPFWAAKEVGFYKQEGVDAELIYISSSSTMAQAMLAREVHISTANSQVIADAGLQGDDLMAMGAVIDVAAF